MIMNEITNSEDVIDSRDVTERIRDLENADELDDDERDELTALRALERDASGYAPDWQYGAALIRDSYFAEYAEQMAEDVGAIDPQADWPLAYIDWDAAADALKIDYTQIDFDGVTYWTRS